MQIIIISTKIATDTLLPLFYAIIYSTNVDFYFDFIEDNIFRCLLFFYFVNVNVFFNVGMNWLKQAHLHWI
jgi:hypothetical protein